MFLNVLRNNEFASYALCILIALGFSFFVFNAEIQANPFCFSDLNLIFFESDILIKSLFYLVWTLSGILANRILMKYKLVDFKGGLFLFFYVMFSVAFWKTNISLDLMLSLLFLILSIQQLFSIHQTTGKISQSLNLGLYLGLSIYFYYPVFVFLIWLIISLAKVKPFKFRDLILVLIGVCIPFYLYVVYHFLNDTLYWWIFEILTQFSFPNQFLKYFQNNYLWLFTCVLLMISLVSTIRKMDKMTVKIRMFYNILLWMTFFSVVILFFGRSILIESIFIFLPLCYFASHYFFTLKRKWLFDLGVLFYLFLLFYK